MKLFRRVAAVCWRNDRGQDVAEYCLITAVIALVALGIFWHVSGGLQGSWNSMNTSLATGNNTTVTSPASAGLAGN